MSQACNPIISQDIIIINHDVKSTSSSNNTPTHTLPRDIKKSTKTTNRKKKSPKSTTPSSTKATTASIIAAANKAKVELSDLRTQAQLKRNDTAWLSTDVSAIASDSKGAGMNESKIVDMALRNNGVYIHDITPRAYSVLVEYAKKYACDLYADAQDYTWHANRKEVQPVDIKLAADLRKSSDITAQSSSHIEALAEDCNSIPLPPIPNNCFHGVVLPPKEYQLTSRTFDVILEPTPSVQMDVKKEESNSARKQSYGAHKGKQIQINLKSTTALPDTTSAPDSATSQPMQIDSNSNKRKSSDITQ